MTEAELAQRLTALGLTLDAKALTAALAGATHLKDASARLAQWLAKDP